MVMSGRECTEKTLLRGVRPSTRGPHRVEAQDTTPSRWRRGFDSRWGELPPAQPSESFGTYFPLITQTPVQSAGGLAAKVRARSAMTADGPSVSAWADQVAAASAKAPFL